MIDKKALSDKELLNVSGGQLEEWAYSDMDLLVEQLKGEGRDFKSLVDQVKEFWTHYERFLYSTDGSQKDLNDLLAYAEKKWNE